MGLSGRRQDYWHRAYARLADGREVCRLLAFVEHVLLAKLVGIARHIFRRKGRIPQPKAEDVILMNTVRNLTPPDPTAPELIQVAPFVHQDVAIL